MHPFLLPKLTEASKAKKNDSKISTMTMPKTMPVQNLLRYISFKAIKIRYDLSIAYLVDIWRSQNSNETTKSGVIYFRR